MKFLINLNLRLNLNNNNQHLNLSLNLNLKYLRVGNLSQHLQPVSVPKRQVLSNLNLIFLSCKQSSSLCKSTVYLR